MRVVTMTGGNNYNNLRLKLVSELFPEGEVEICSGQHLSREG